MTTSKKLPYLERPLEARVRTNLMIASRLFKAGEYSSSVMRSVIAAEVFVSGLVRDRLELRLGRSSSQNLMRKLSLSEKLTLCFDYLYGFSVAKKLPKTFSLVMRHAQQRNKIAHEGAIARKRDAVEAYTAATALIRRIARELRLDTGGFGRYLNESLE